MLRISPTSLFCLLGAACFCSCGSINHFVKARNQAVINALSKPMDWFKGKSKEEKPLKQDATQFQRIRSGIEPLGMISMVDQKNRFVLIRTAYPDAIVAGTKLEVLGPLGTAAKLEASPERRRNLLVADLMEGNALVGNTVYIAKEGQVAKLDVPQPATAQDVPPPPPEPADLPDLQPPSHNGGDIEPVPGPVFPNGAPELPEIPDLGQ